MGRVARWLKALFGIKKDKEQNQSFNAGDRRNLGSSGRGETGLCQNPATIPPNITQAEAAWLKSFYNDSDKEQSKHAIAVAAATAAAADAAVAAAQAAVAVVRLTNQGRRNPFHGGAREISAAVTIQCVFRGYLARKALKALKGLVKLQALVRGFMVRKQATATLHGMQALIRAQATVRAHKYHEFSRISETCHTHFPESLENFDDTTSECIATIHSRRLSSCFEPNRLATDESSKIVEMDTSRPKSRYRRRNASLVSDSGEDSFGKTLSSPYPSSRLRNGGISCEEWQPSTAQSTPRFVEYNGPVTPSKSVRSAIDVGFFRQYMGFPNYMSNTQSFKAKLRSQSAPKQRPESGLKKRLSLNAMESRSSLSGVRMRRSCSQAQEAVNFKNVIMSKLDKSS